MINKTLTLQEAQRKGGINRARILSKERRVEIAVKASLAAKEARERRKTESKNV